jgi:hypothetical protein
MISEFSSLNDQEQEFMLKVPILVCILIAGADGEIDKKEIREAIAITQKNKTSNKVLANYFLEASVDFEDKLKVLIQSYPYESTQREPLLILELSQINTIWPKLPPGFSNAFYVMLMELSEKIASSSGGWLGINSVGEKEAKYVSLPMIQAPSKN